MLESKTRVFNPARQRRKCEEWTWLCAFSVLARKSLAPFLSGFFPLSIRPKKTRAPVWNSRWRDAVCQGAKVPRTPFNGGNRRVGLTTFFSSSISDNGRTVSMRDVNTAFFPRIPALLNSQRSRCLDTDNVLGKMGWCDSILRVIN